MLEWVIVGGQKPILQWRDTFLKGSGRSKTLSCLPGLINVQHPYVVVFWLSLGLGVGLRRCEQALELRVSDRVSEVGVEPVVQGALSLREVERAGFTQHFLELFDQELAVLGHKLADLSILSRVLPHAQGGRVEADLAVGLLDAPEGLLPLVQVQHSVLPDVDSVEQVFDHWVRRRLLASKFMCLGHQLAKVGEGDPAVLLKIELYKNNRDISPQIQIWSPAPI